MADYNEHINQANHNLSFLNTIGTINDNFWDWKITASFYIGVHIINAHLANSVNQHYRSHNDVERAINPYGKIAATCLDEDTYTAYDALSNLSRRARYLISEKRANQGTNVFSTYDKHFGKALVHLNQIFKWFEVKYGYSFPTSEIHCPQIGDNLKYFKHRETVLAK